MGGDALRYRIVQKGPNKFEIQYREFWVWKFTDVRSTLEYAKIWLEDLRTLKSKGEVVYETKI